MFFNVSFFNSTRKATPKEIDTINNLKLIANNPAELNHSAQNVVRNHVKNAITFYILTCDPIRKKARAIFTPDDNGPQFAIDKSSDMRDYASTMQVVKIILERFDPEKPIVHNSRIEHLLRQFANFDWSWHCAEPPTPLKNNSK